MNKREECLRKANDMVNGSREGEYGSPENNFKTIAELWSVYLEREITPHDVAILMALMKVGRIKTGTFKADSYVDLAGYTACAYEIASNDEHSNTYNSAIREKLPNTYKVAMDCSNIDPKLMKATLCEYAEPSVLREYMEEQRC